MSETILTNATLILEDRTVNGTIVFGRTGISALDEGRSSLPSAIDAGGEFVAPGLIEMHTDNAEKHFVPRPGVFWPDALAAIIAHDAQLAAAGVTTVYDSICAGSVFGANDHRRQIFGKTVEAVEAGVASEAFRIEHRIHIRCELTGPEIIDDLAPYAHRPLVQLASLMDHTPGQRQWRNLDDLRRYNVGSGEKTLAEHERDVAIRMRIGPENRRRNWPVIVEMFSSRGVPLATHDDTSIDDVADAVAAGAVISEFPTTREAAVAAKAAGLVTVAGAPNVVRGGSHSGGVSASELALAGVLDGLSSDYVPASLLQAVVKLARLPQIGWPQAMGKVTWRIADALGLADRGRLSIGRRADIVQFRLIGDTPVVRTLWCEGRRAF